MIGADDWAQAIWLRAGYPVTAAQQATLFTLAAAPASWAGTRPSTFIPEQWRRSLERTARLANSYEPTIEEITACLV
jgi:hypothetical protein